MVGRRAAALRRHENKGIKDSVSTMAVKREEQTMRKYHSIDRSIETIGLRTRSGLRAGLPYSNISLYVLLQISGNHEIGLINFCQFWYSEAIPVELICGGDPQLGASDRGGGLFRSYDITSISISTF